MGLGTSRPFPGDVDHPEFELLTASKAIDQKQAQLFSGLLGVPIDETHYGEHGVIVRHFERGAIYWTRMTDAHEVHGAIFDYYRSLGAESSFLGPPTTDETSTPDGVGRFNHFAGGAIYWTPRTGAHEVHGAIRDHWASLGWETSYFGYPVWDEHDWVDPSTSVPGRMSDFQFGQIGWTPERGPVELPETRTYDSGSITFPDGIPVNGWVQLVLMSNGRFRFNFHAHNSGAAPFNFCTLGVVASGPSDDGRGFVDGAGLFGIRHVGVIHGMDPGERSNDITGEGDSGFLRTAWPWMRNGPFQAMMSVQDSLSDALSSATDKVRNFLRDLYGIDPGEEIGTQIIGYRSDIRDV